MARSKIQTRLCPHCANSIAVDALTCPYCKADLLSAEPEWPERDADFGEPGPASIEKQKLTVKSKAILMLGLAVFALGVYLVGGNRERSDLGPVLEQQQRALQERDAAIKAMETQLAELRHERQRSTQQVTELKAKLQESGNELVAMRKKLSDAKREVDRLATRNSAPQRAVARTAESSVTSGAPARGSAVEPGTYETTRAATIYEGPAGSSRVVSKIAKGTQVTAVRSIGTWVEIRSKHGNPPGFVRADDLALIARAK